MKKGLFPIILVFGLFVFILFSPVGETVTIAEIEDTNIVGINDGDILQYNDSNSNWDNVYFPFYMSDTVDGIEWLLESDHILVGGTYGDWSYFRKLTINPDYIDSDLTNFPVLINCTDADLISKCQANGEDLIFVNLANDTQFIHGIERWTPNGFDVWVNITFISSSVDTVFLMYYGNAGASDSQNPEGVWDNNYIGVYHFDELAGATCYDSTSNSNDGAYVGGMPNRVIGKMGYGQDFEDGNGDYIALPAGAMVGLAGTVETFVKFDDIEVRYYLWTFLQDADDFTTISIYGDAEPNKLWFHGKISGGTQWDMYEDATISTNWDYIASAYQTNDAILILNTTTIGTDTSVTPANWAYEFINIGTNVDPTVKLDAVLDEFRVSDIRRSNPWLYASFHSQNKSDHLGNFLSFSGEFVHDPSSTYIDHNYSMVFDDENDIMICDFNIEALGFIGVGAGNPFNQDLNTTDDPTFDDLVITGDVDVSGDLHVDGSDILVDGSVNPQFKMQSSNSGSHEWSFYGTATAFTIRDDDTLTNVVRVFNNSLGDSVVIRPNAVYLNNGKHNLDFNVRGDTITNLFFVNAGTDRVGVNDSTPDAGFLFDVNGDIQCTSLDETSDSRIKSILFELRDKPGALRRFCDSLTVLVYNPICHNETPFGEGEGDYALEFGEVDTDVLEVGLIAQDVFDICINFSNDQTLNEVLAYSVVHVPENESQELWSLNYRMISLLMMENNRLCIRNLENFLMGYGYDPLEVY